MSGSCRLFIGIFTCMLLMGNTFSYAQSSGLNPSITEVYGNYVSKLTAEQVSWLNSQLDRCEVQKKEYTSGETYLQLSGVPLINKYVPNIQADVFAGTPPKINPLKYSINFTNKEDQVFRIDHTEYVLMVRGKK